MSAPQNPPPRRRTELLALLVAAVLVVVGLVSFLTVDDGNETAPTIGGNKENPETDAPYSVEPPASATGLE